MEKRRIPITKLRHFYKALAELRLSTNTQLSIVEDINRKVNYEQLISWYNQSKDIFSKKYSNIDENFLLPRNNRKKLPDIGPRVSKTTEVIAVFDSCKDREINVVGNAKYNFQYKEREVSPFRTTNAEDEDGIQAKSGTGGIDFIGLNCNDALPILGEIKVGGDQNPFYALMQLLTYLSELSSPNQIKRINKHKLFGKEAKDFTDKTSFYLYVLLVLDGFSDKRKKIYDHTKELAVKLEKPHIKKIEKIVFLKMNPKTQIITII